MNPYCIPFYAPQVASFVDVRYVVKSNCTSYHADSGDFLSCANGSREPVNGKMLPSIDNLFTSLHLQSGGACESKQSFSETPGVHNASSPPSPEHVNRVVATPAEAPTTPCGMNVHMNSSSSRRRPRQLASDRPFVGHRTQRPIDPLDRCACSCTGNGHVVDRRYTVEPSPSAGAGRPDSPFPSAGVSGSLPDRAESSDGAAGKLQSGEHVSNICFPIGPQPERTEGHWYAFPQYGVTSRDPQMNVHMNGYRAFPGSEKLRNYHMNHMNHLNHVNDRGRGSQESSNMSDSSCSSACTGPLAVLDYVGDADGEDSSIDDGRYLHDLDGPASSDDAARRGGLPDSDSDRAGPLLGADGGEGCFEPRSLSRIGEEDSESRGHRSSGNDTRISPQTRGHDTASDARAPSPAYAPGDGAGPTVPMEVVVGGAGSSADGSWAEHRATRPPEPRRSRARAGHLGVGVGVGMGLGGGAPYHLHHLDLHGPLHCTGRDGGGAGPGFGVGVGVGGAWEGRTGRYMRRHRPIRKNRSHVTGSRRT